MQGLLWKQDVQLPRCIVLSARYSYCNQRGFILKYFQFFFLVPMRTLNSYPFDEYIRVLRNRSQSPRSVAQALVQIWPVGILGGRNDLFTVVFVAEKITCLANAVRLNKNQVLYLKPREPSGWKKEKKDALKAFKSFYYLLLSLGSLSSDNSTLGALSVISELLRRWIRSFGWKDEREGNEYRLALVRVLFLLKVSVVYWVKFMCFLMEIWKWTRVEIIWYFVVVTS